MVLNYILIKNIISKKVVYTIKFYLQFSCVAGCLKHSNDIPNLNIHKCANYNVIEIYMNRLSTTANFHSVGLLDNDVSQSTFILEKGKNIWQGRFLPNP